MAQKLALSIPTPCHENWNAMTLQQQGRFCGQCNKTVVDFTLMTDGQILDLLKKETGSTCGRFTDDQLQRPLVAPLKPKWYSTGMWKFIISAALLGKTVEGKAQQNADTAKKYTINPRHHIMGKMIVRQPQAVEKFELTVADENGKPLAAATVRDITSNKTYYTNEQGKVSIQAKKGNKVSVNYIGFKPTELVLSNIQQNIKLAENHNLMEMGFIIIKKEDDLENEVAMDKTTFIYTIKDTATKEIIPGATVVIKRKGNRTTVSSDKNGKVKIKRMAAEESITITVSSVGYETKTISITGADVNSNRVKQDIELSQQLVKEGEVVVLVYKYSSRGCGRITTGAVTKVSAADLKSDTSISLVKKISSKKTNSIVYPNPVKVGDQVTVNFLSTKEEFIVIQLFSAEGKWLKQEKFKVAKGNNKLQFEIPNNIPAQQAIVTITNSVGKQIDSHNIIVMQ